VLKLRTADALMPALRAGGTVFRLDTTVTTSLNALPLFDRRAIEGTIDNLARLIWSSDQTQERLLDAQEDLEILYGYIAGFPFALSPEERELCWFCQMVSTWLRQQLDRIEAEINKEYDEHCDQMWTRHEYELAAARLDAAEAYEYR
jgi:hypothetical protein